MLRCKLHFTTLRYNLGCKWSAFCTAFGIVMLIAPPLQINGTSCLDRFRDFQIFHLESDSELSSHYGRDDEIAWMKDEMCLLVGSATGLWLYDITLPENPLHLAEANGVQIVNVTVSPDSSLIGFSVAEQPDVYLIDETGLVDSIQVEGDLVTTLAFSPDGKLAIAETSSREESSISFYFGHAITIWDLGNHKTIFRISDDRGVVRKIAFDEDSQHMAIQVYEPMIPEGEDIEYWDVPKQNLIWSWDKIFNKQPHRDYDPIAVFRIQLQQSLLVIGGLYGFMGFDEFYGSGIFVYNNLNVHPNRIAEISISQQDDSSDDGLTAFAINSTATMIASVNSKGRVQLWDISNGSELTRFNTYDKPVSSLSFSSDDQYLALFVKEDDETSSVGIWDVERKQEIAVLESD